MRCVLACLYSLVLGSSCMLLGLAPFALEIDDGFCVIGLRGLCRC